MGDESSGWTAVEVAEAVRRGERKAVEVLDDALARIAERNPDLNAVFHLDEEGARAAAERVDALVAMGEDPGPLAGVPFGVKDLEHCEGMPTTYGSLLYMDRPPAAADSLHVARLRAAGAVPVGKTTAPEFGMVAYTSTRAWGTTRNPWDLTRTPGGSSGGSASIVAAGALPMATASDGGGSIRIPAAFSGLYGLKPSFGRIPHPEHTASQTSVPGVMVTTVRDAARHLDATAGPSGLDRTSLPASGVVYEDVIETLDVAGLRVAWSVDLGFAVVDPEVAAITEAAATALVEAAKLTWVERDVVFRDPGFVWLTANIIDLWQDLEEGMFPERADDLGMEGRVAAEASKDVMVRQLPKLLRARRRVEQQVGQLFDDIDVLLLPSTAIPAFAAEGPMPTEIDGQQVMPAMGVPFTMFANMAWNPAASVPAGFTSDGLPVGLQIMCRCHADDVVLRLSRIFEQKSPWPRTAPVA